MQITGLLPFKAYKSPCKNNFAHKNNEANIRQSRDLAALKSGFTRITNSFLDNHDETPLTLETIEKLQNKFWTTGIGNQVLFTSQLWRCLDEVAKKLLEKYEIRTNLQTENKKISHRKKPVVFSTREGLDVTLDLKNTDNGLIVASASINPGGSSINVARSLNNFGTPCELIGIRSCGERGDIFTELLEKEGIDFSKLLETHDDTRFHFCTFACGKEYWIVSLSPCLNPKEIDELTTRLFDSCQSHSGQVLALANNPPRGASKEYMGEIVGSTQDKFGMFVIYDTKLKAVEKELLFNVLQKGPSMIKPNLAEFAEITGQDEYKMRNDKNLTIHEAQELIKKLDIKLVLISMDKDGALLVDKNRAAYAKAPDIKVSCTIGAGDAGIASMIDKAKKEKYSFKKPQDKQFKGFLSAFIAGGSATATKPGTSLASLEEVQDMEKKITVQFV